VIHLFFFIFQKRFFYETIKSELDEMFIEAGFMFPSQCILSIPSFYEKKFHWWKAFLISTIDSCTGNFITLLSIIRRNHKSFSLHKMLATNQELEISPIKFMRFYWWSVKNSIEFSVSIHRTFQQLSVSRCKFGNRVFPICDFSLCWIIAGRSLVSPMFCRRASFPKVSF
jgi:hypothetical protein